MKGTDKAAQKKSDTQSMLVAATGAGLYWAFMLASVISHSALNRGSNEVLPVETRLSSLAISLALCLLALAARRFVRMPKAQKVAITCALALWLAHLTVSVLSSSVAAFAYVQPMVRSLAISLVPSFLMLFWSLAFACMSRKIVVRVVVLATLFATMGYLVLASASALVDGAMLQEALILASLVLLFVFNRRIPFYVEKRELCQDRRSLISFFCGRVAIGLSFGFLTYAGSIALVGGRWEVDSSSVLLAIPAMLALAALAVQMRRSAFDSHLFLMPLVASAALLLPVVMLGSFPLYPLWGVAWISWIVSSYAQLSELKHQLGMSESALSFTEKVAVIASWIIGLFVSRACMDGVVYDGTVIHAVFLVCVLAVLAILFWAMALLNGLVEQKKKGQAIRASIKSEEEQTDLLMANLAERYGLTARETEISSLLVRGYTRSHISSTLVIADGTVKTHIEHIYKKTDCHARSEFIALYESERASYCSE